MTDATRYYAMPTAVAEIPAFLLRFLAAEDLSFVHEDYPLDTEKMTVVHCEEKDTFVPVYYVPGTPFTDWAYTNGMPELEARMRVLLEAGGSSTILPAGGASRYARSPC